MGYWFSCTDPSGREYRAENHMAIDHGVKPSTFNARKQAGLPLSLCLMPYESPYSNDEENRFVYKEKTYKSFRQCCLELGLSYSAVINRIFRYDLTPEEAIEETIKHNTFEYDGKTYKNLNQCCKALDISTSSVVNRANYHNLDLVEAIDQTIKYNKNKNIPFTYNGINYKNFKECCLLLGLQYNTVYHHVWKYGLTPEQALDKVIAKRKKKVS